MHGSSTRSCKVAMNERGGIWSITITYLHRQTLYRDSLWCIIRKTSSFQESLELGAPPSQARWKTCVQKGMTSDCIGWKMMISYQRYNMTDSIEIQEDTNTVMTPSIGASDPLAKYVSDMNDLSTSHLGVTFGSMVASNLRIEV